MNDGSTRRVRLDKPVLIYCAVVVRFGRTVEPGFLPVFSVDTEEEAEQLLVAACATNLRGEFIAEELGHTQSLENLYAFGRRLERTWAEIKRREEKE